MLLNSNKLRVEMNLPTNKKILQMITETRICSILVEHRTFQGVKHFIKDSLVHIELKIMLLEALISFLRLLKHKNMVMR